MPPAPSLARRPAQLAAGASVPWSRGADFYTATQQAYALLYGEIQRQATMLSFVDAFCFLGIIFVALIPLVFLIQKHKHQQGPVAAH